MKKGYTLVEVSLVIAITGLLFIAFVSSVASTINTRRYTTVAETFLEYMRSVYSSVVAVQNDGAGNSGQAIYGKLVTFSETGNPHVVHTYDIIGDAVQGDHISRGTAPIAALKQVHAGIATATGGLASQASYELEQGAWLETTAPRAGAGTGTSFTGSLIIFRSPASGQIHTYYNSTTIPASTCVTCIPGATDPLSSELDNFTIQALDICIASDDQPHPNVRRNLHIDSNGNSTSAVQLIPQDATEAEGNQCTK